MNRSSDGRWERERAVLPGGPGLCCPPPAGQAAQEQETEDPQRLHLHLRLRQVHHVLLQLHILADGPFTDRSKFHHLEDVDLYSITVSLDRYLRHHG